MANYMRAYTIAFEDIDGDCVYSRDIMIFFKKVEDVLNKTPSDIVRKINGKIMRVHAYEWNINNKDYVVVPLGKLKEKNKPFGNDPNTQKLVDFSQDMYDVNVLAYHKKYKIALISTNQQGPGDKDIESYLNSFLKEESNLKIRLRPVYQNNDLSKIRNAKQARSITIALDVGRPFNDFLSGQVKTEQGIYSSLMQLMNFSRKNLSSNTFSLTLGLGRKKNETLDIEALLELLDAINLDAECIREITVNYRTGYTQKLDVAKLKASNIALRITFETVDNQLNAKYILDNMDDILRKEKSKFYQQINDYFSNPKEIGEDYEIEISWNENENN